MSQVAIREKIRELDTLERRLMEVEESASGAFQEWYKLNDERSGLIGEIRSLMRDERYTEKRTELGPFRVTVGRESDIDISTLRKEAPAVLALPGVVAKVSIKSLLAAKEAGLISEEDAKVVLSCIVEGPGSPKIYGPKAVQL